MERQQRREIREGVPEVTDIGLISLRDQEMSRQDRDKMSAKLARMILHRIQSEGGQLQTAVVLREMKGKLGRSTSEVGSAIDYGEEMGLFTRNIKDEILTAKE